MGDGFERAIEVLGQAFLTHPANRGLRRRLREGTLAPQAFRDELVLLAYRLVRSLAVGNGMADAAAKTLGGSKVDRKALKDVVGHLDPLPGVEELAAFHEMMLATEPALDVRRRQFNAVAEAGQHRKRTGSYYTPAAFIESLLDSTLEPVMEEALSAASRARRSLDAALLGLRVCDPACGAGNFLVAAARRLARRLAEVRIRRRRRSNGHPLVDVIEWCIRGVDISQTAVELCRLALQLDVLGAGSATRPKADGHIVWGNALIAASPCGWITDGLDEGVLFNWYYAFADVQVPGRGPAARGCGFDAILGNPPYRAAMSAAEREVARRLYPLAAPAANTAADFVELCSRLVRPGGRVGLVVPKSLTYSYAWRDLRAALTPTVVSAIDVGRGWDDVLLEQVLLTWQRGKRRRARLAVGTLAGDALTRGRVRAGLIERLGILPTGLSQDEVKLLEHMLSHSRGWLSDVCTTRRGTGLQKFLRAEGDVPVVGGKEIRALGALRPRGFVQSEDLAPEQVRWTAPPQAIFQNIIAHVTRPVDHIRLIGAVARERVACLDTVNLLTIHDRHWSPAMLCAWLMSDLVGWFVYAGVYNKAVRTMHFDGYFLAKIPLPEFASLSAFTEAAEELAREPGKPDGWRRVNAAVLDAYRVPANWREGRIPAICRTDALGAQAVPVVSSVGNQ